jgi:hypothetical protein
VATLATTQPAGTGFPGTMASDTSLVARRGVDAMKSPVGLHPMAAARLIMHIVGAAGHQVTANPLTGPPAQPHQTP